MDVNSFFFRCFTLTLFLSLPFFLALRLPPRDSNWIKRWCYVIINIIAIIYHKYELSFPLERVFSILFLFIFYSAVGDASCSLFFVFHYWPDWKWKWCICITFISVEMYFIYFLIRLEIIITYNKINWLLWNLSAN